MRQVSWLPGLRSHPPSQSLGFSGLLDASSPVTVAGAVAFAFPNLTREGELNHFCPAGQHTTYASENGQTQGCV